MRSTATSRRRRLKPHSRSFAAATPLTSASSWSTVVRSNLSRSQTTELVLVSSKVACKGTVSTNVSSTILGSRTDSQRTRRPSKTVCSTSSRSNPARLLFRVLQGMPRTRATAQRRRRMTHAMAHKVWSSTSRLIEPQLPNKPAT